MRQSIAKMLDIRFSESVYPSEDLREEAFFDSNLLMIDGVDYSTEFAECIDKTGYIITYDSRDSEYEKEEKARILKAGLVWAECARSYGLEVWDPDPAIVDGWETTPTALLSSTIHESQLREVLQKCPATGEELSEELFADPSIGFNIPGFRGRQEPDYPMDEDLFAELIILESIINEFRSSGSVTSQTGLGTG
ncbi:MAG: hypothetical protein LBG99_06405 [Propionibacteriaceae bacterium]|jgi:hypothetical protein|nr:hypothetical protein [Propionibacteriaceae bacterium]